MYIVCNWVHSFQNGIVKIPKKFTQNHEEVNALTVLRIVTAVTFASIFNLCKHLGEKQTQQNEG